MNPDRIQGITTGYDLLDKKTGSLRVGELLLLVADTGMGKSIFTINLLCNVIAQTNHHCSYFDLEKGKYATFTHLFLLFTEEQPNSAKSKEGVNL